MNSFENTSRPENTATLESLRMYEEAARGALEKAMKPISEGGATESVIEVLQGTYLIAKQEREKFEAGMKQE